MKIYAIYSGNYKLDSDVEMGPLLGKPFCGPPRHVPIGFHNPIPALVQSPIGRGAFSAYGNSAMVIIRDELREAIEKELPEAVWGSCLIRGRKDGSDAVHEALDKHGKRVYWKPVPERSSMYVPPEKWLEVLKNNGSDAINEDQRRMCKVCGFQWMALLEGLYVCAYPRQYFEHRSAGMYDKYLFLRDDLFHSLKLAKGSRVDSHVVKVLYDDIEELKHKYPGQSFWSRTRGRVI